MNTKKIYEGELYCFSRNVPSIGSGGNGAVYDVEVKNIKFPVVAKFFEYEGKNKEKRYSRFKNEVEVLKKLSDLEGIINIIDKQCPVQTPDRKDEAWYLMPKAKQYKISRKNSLFKKINDMLHLAYIIKSIHERGYAHRDIKPENILVIDGKLVLSDFGLIWEMEEERLTEENERIGPYKIMPPELENVQTELDLDFRASDVYLFAKVLWMTLKEDNIGFKGQYNRGDIQIYLEKDFYEVDTLEPVHKLIEEATCEKMNDRISIEKCIEYLVLQKSIIDERGNNSLEAGLLRQLQFEENCKKVIASNEPDELVYEDKRIMYEMLKGIASKANVFVKNLNDNQEGKQIQITDFFARADGLCQFTFYNNGKRMKEYLLCIKKMTYLKKKEMIILDLEDLDLVTQEYISYRECQKGFGNMFSKIYFSSDERIIITKPIKM